MGFLGGFKNVGIVAGVAWGVMSRKDLLGGFAGGGVGAFVFVGRWGGFLLVGKGMDSTVVGSGRDSIRGGGREGCREGASRSSSSVSDVESLRPWATVVVFDVPVLGRAGSNSLVDCKGRFSGFEYPAAARVCDMTPCKPVSPVKAFFGLVVMKRCSCVPCQGSSCLSPSKSLMSLSSEATLGRFGALMVSSAAFIFTSLAWASFFLRVSSRMVVIESTGREMLLMVDEFRSLAAFFRRLYSAWCRCLVNVWATAWNSSSTMM